MDESAKMNILYVCMWLSEIVDARCSIDWVVGSRMVCRLSVDGGDWMLHVLRATMNGPDCLY